MSNDKVMCKDCEYLRIDKPDKYNEGHAYCLKYDLSTMLIGKQYTKKIDRLECYKAGGKNEN